MTIFTVAETVQHICQQIAQLQSLCQLATRKDVTFALLVEFMEKFATDLSRPCTLVRAVVRHWLGFDDKMLLGAHSLT